MRDARFDEPLVVEGLPDGNWKVHGGFDYHTNISRKAPAPPGPWVIQVPDGFVTDFASVPRPLWNIFPPTGNYRNAAVVHDFLYRTKGIATKAEADDIFYEAMQYLGVGWWTRHILYTAVHRFGGGSYKGGVQ